MPSRDELMNIQSKYLKRVNPVGGGRSVFHVNVHINGMLSDAFVALGPPIKIYSRNQEYMQIIDFGSPTANKAAKRSKRD